MVKLRLGVPLFSGTQRCSHCAVTDALLDVYGHHASICRTGTGNVRRHDTLRDALAVEIRNTARNYGITVRTEQRFEDPDLSNIDPAQLTASQRRRHQRALDRRATGSSEQPNEQLRMDVFVDDIGFAPTPQGFDVAIISPHSTVAGYTPRSTRPARFHIVRKEQEKQTHYRFLCRQENMELYPMVIDTYGCIGDGFDKGAQRIANFLALKNGTSPLTEKQNLLTRLTCLVVKYVAVCVNSRLVQSLESSVATA